MKRIIFSVLLIIIAASLFAQNGKEIMQNVMDNQKVNSSAMDIKMTLINKNGDNSVRRIQTLVDTGEDQTKTITLFLSPARVKNTRFLTISNDKSSDDQWIYLPALRKVKRIASGEQNGSFMGSDFSYSDMSSTGSVDDSTHTKLREEMFAGKDCYVVESVPDESKKSSYGKTVSWVDKDTWLTVKVEFYSKDKSEIIKKLTCENFVYKQDHWLAKKVIMHNVKIDHKTVLEIVQVKYDLKIKAGYFTTSFLETGKVR